MTTTETKIQMRFADVDMLGHVNNVNQQHYYDIGKNDYFGRVLGLEPCWKERGVIIVATSTSYKGQIRYMENIAVTTRAIRVGNKSFTLFQQIINTDTQEIKSECTSTLVAYNYTEQHSIEIPREWKERFDPVPVPETKEER